MKARLAIALVPSALVAALAACSQVTRPTMSPGGNAPLYLTAARPRMVVEVTPTNGRAPDERALNLLLQRATERCHKPQGVDVVVNPMVELAPVASGQRAWTIDDLQAFEARNRTVADDAETAVLYVAYVDGEHAGNRLTLALSYGSHSIAVFKDRLGGLEGAALVHELGHQLGLVNTGAPMKTVHEDLTHRGHDRDPRCVMYWRLENGPFGEMPPDDYDENCKLDLQHAGGR